MMHLLMLLLCLTTNPLFSTFSDPVCVGKSESCRLLNKWYNEGSAAGNIGDYYDNRDRNHSRIKLKNYPQLSEVEYTFDERSQNKDWGGKLTIVPHITIGNSSTAGKLGSNPRAFYYTTQEGMEFLYTQYRKNNLYIYPEHKDYDPVADNGKNDVLPTNTPYLILSKGSSGSDRPFIQAFVKTLAAFNPEVKTTLANAGILMPTLQQIFRMSNASIDTEADYLSGKAHPPVFNKDNIRVKKMIETAHDMTMDKIPPFVRLQELEVDDETPTFKSSDHETIANTPSVIAKIYRGNEQKKEIIVSAKESQDLFARPLKYHWVVLNGDENEIEINTKDGGSVAEITIPYQKPFIVDEATGLKSSRVDIGVFVDNGETLSAPAFVTAYNLPNELRTYDESGQIREVFYAAKDMGFEVQSWSNLLKVISNKNGAFPSEILQEYFSPEQIALFRKDQPVIQILEQDVLNAQAELQNLTNLRKKVGNRLVPHKEIKEVKKKLSDAEQSLQQALNKKQPALNNRSIKEDLLQVISQYVYDLSFYSREKKMIENTAKGNGRQLHKLVVRLSRDGVLDKKPQDLTQYERSKIEELNLYIFTEVLYPSSLSMWEQPNYVDPRLATPKKILRRFSNHSEGEEPKQNDIQVH